ncbi:MAG: tetraacyldisaccharide 4'-kinase [Gammaproteobacteria bacterium]
MTYLRTSLAEYFRAHWYAPRVPWYLLPLAVLFGAAAALRRGLYVRGLLQVTRVEARVVVVGNITVGGSGKTPLVAWLAGRLAGEGVRVGIVTRGYGGENRRPRILDTDSVDAGDEALWLARETDVPVAVGRDRPAAARLLIAAHHPDIILSDDGLQHYRLARDVEIVAVDGGRGFGNGALLPAGPLREPPARLASADAVVVKGEGAPPLPSDVPALRMRYTLADAVPLVGGAAVPLAEFRGRKVAALAAIADPESFFHALEAAGLSVERHPLPDHADRVKIAEALAAIGNEHSILMTDKDAAKLAVPSANTWRVPLTLALPEADAARLITLVRGANEETEEEK